MSWWFVLEDGPAITAWTVLLGRRRSFLLLPIGEGRLYCYADVNSSNSRDPTDGAFSRFVELFGDFDEPVPGILGRLSPARAPYFSPIEEVTQQPWVKGRVVLIGDAAHATSPNMAEGASMAMEDALVLAEVLATGRPLPECLTAFETRRAPRVRWVQTQTRRRDRLRNLPAAIRDAVLRVAGKRIVRANYRPLTKGRNSRLERGTAGADDHPAPWRRRASRRGAHLTAQPSPGQDAAGSVEPSESVGRAAAGGRGDPVGPARRDAGPSMKRILHTYHEPLAELAPYYDAARLLELWTRSWSRFGWQPVVLSRADAEKHPKWPCYAAAVRKLPTVNSRSYEAANYHRWMAMAVAGGGFMSDADVLPLEDWRPETHEGLTIYSVDHLEEDGACPCFVHGDAAQYEAVCDHFAAAGAWAGSCRHVSDQVLLRARRIPFNLRRDVLTHDDPRIPEVAKAAHFKNDAIRSETGTKSERVARLYSRLLA